MSSILRTQERARARRDGDPFMVECGSCHKRQRFQRVADNDECPQCGFHGWEDAAPRNTVGKVKGERQPLPLRFRIRDLHPAPVVKEAERRPGFLRRAVQAATRAFRRLAGRGR